MSTSDDGGVQIERVIEVTDEVVEAWQTLMPQLSSHAQPPTAAWLAELVSSDSRLYMARLDGRLVGSLTLSFTKIPVGLRGWIDDVVVDQSARGRGIGERLTVHALHEASQAKVREVKLTSDPSRLAAHKLYQKLGFVQRQSSVYRFQED